MNWKFWETKKQTPIEDNSYQRHLLGNVIGSKIIESAFKVGATNTLGDSNFKYTAPQLREYARDAQKNISYIGNYFRNVVNFTIGDGIQFQAKVKNDSKNYDTVANEVIENAWYDWCKNCKIGQKMPFVKVQKMLLEAFLRDGEIFVITLRGSQYGKYGFQLQIIESDWVDYNLNDDLKNGSYIRHGIEYDAMHTPLAIYISKFTQSSNTESVLTPENYTRVPYDDVIHLYNQDRFSQGRGYSVINSVISTVKMLQGVEEAGTIAMRVGATKLGFLSRQSGDVEYTGEQLVNGSWVNSMEPGEIEILPDGYQFQSHNPTFPDNAVVPFLKYILHSISVGLGVSYTTLTMDLSEVNYSSIRAGTDIEKKLYKNLQSMMIEEFLDRVYEKWLEMALISGALNPLPASKLWKFSNWTFMACEQAYVNPIDDVNADIIAINNGLKTHSEILAKRGIDFADHIEKLKMEKQMLLEAGLDFSQNKPVN